MENPFISFVKRGLDNIPATKAAKVNPGAAWFYGWRMFDEGNFEYTDEGLTRAYLASLWAARCIYLRAQKVASIPLIVKTLDDKYPGRDGKAYDQPIPSRVHQHILQRFLDRSFKSVRRRIEYDYCIWGRAFLSVNQGGFRRLNPTTIEVEKDPERGIMGYQQYVSGAKAAKWAPNKMVYIYDFDPEDDLGGVPLLAWALQTIGAENSTRQYIASFFENDATPAGMITSDNLMREPDIKTISDWWSKTFKGPDNAGKIAIMPGMKYEQISPNIEDMALAELRLEVRREICAAFGVPMTIAGADEAANYSTSQSQYSVFYTETIIPQVELIIDAINDQLVPHLSPNLKVVAELSDIEVLQEDRAELTTRLTVAVGAGMKTLNEARRIEGDTPFDEDYLILPNVGLVRVRDLPKIADLALQGANTGGGGGFGGPPEPPAPEQPPAPPAPEAPAPETPPEVGPSEPDKNTAQYIVPISRDRGPLPPSDFLHPRAAKAAGSEAYVSIALTNNPDVIKIQDQLRAQGIAGDDIEYQDPETFHVTLVYAPQVDDVTLRGIANKMGPMSTELRAMGISSFDTPDGDAIHIALSKTPTLKACQEAVFKLLLDAGVMMSEYSIPEQWQPHITLAYAKKGTSDDIDPSEMQPFTVYATEVDISRPDYRVVRVITPANVPSVDLETKHRVALDDLKRWQRKASTKGLHKPFSSTAIPESIQTFVRWDLEALEEVGEEERSKAIKRTFEWAAKAVQNKDTTPEEFETFWSGIGDTSKDLFKMFEQLVSAPEIRDRLAQEVEAAGNTEVVPAFFERLTQEWTDKLLGTEEEPGPLAKIYLAGAVRGNELHQATLPKKHRARKALVNVGWNILAKDALEKARTQTFDLVRGINRQTADAFRNAMGDWISRGGSLTGLTDLLKGRLRGLDIPEGWSDSKIKWATSRNRARLIAQTESTKVFVDGNKARWQQVGVKEWRWRTQADYDVCNTCKALNNQIVPIDGAGFVVPPAHRKQYGQHVKQPPIHPGDRCFVAPVTAYGAPKPKTPQLIVE